MDQHAYRYGFCLGYTHSIIHEGCLALALVLTAIILCACGGGNSGDHKSGGSYLKKVHNWQIAEAQCPPVYTPLINIGDPQSELAELAYFIAGRVEYKYGESPDVWSTSQETLAAGRDDCEGEVGLFLRAVKDSGLAKRWGMDVRGRMVKLPNGKEHAIAVVYVVMDGEEVTYEVDGLVVYKRESDWPVLIEYGLEYIY
jgi:hypothetical protein